MALEVNLQPLSLTIMPSLPLTAINRSSSRATLAPERPRSGIGEATGLSGRRFGWQNSPSLRIAADDQSPTGLALPSSEFARLVRRSTAPTALVADLTPDIFGVKVGRNLGTAQQTPPSCPRILLQHREELDERLDGVTRRPEIESAVPSLTMLNERG